jgi:hypothetical protein
MNPVLPYTFGTELTGIHISYDEKYNLRIGEWGEIAIPDTVPREERVHWRRNRFGEILNQSYAAIRNGLRRRRVSYANCGADGHCIETSSKICRTFDQLRHFSIGVRDTYEENLFFPKNPTAVCGGAHIHVGINDHKLKWAIAKDLVMRPYLPWIFGEPDEEGAMNVYINKKIEIGHNEWAGSTDRFLNYLMRDEYIESSSLYGQGNKDMMFLWTGTEMDTFEFRFFEMAPTWDEQFHQINWLCAYIRWMQERTANKDYTHVQLCTNEYMQTIQPKPCVEAFEELCEDIGVDVEDYEHLFRRNLYPRWREERVRR